MPSNATAAPAPDGRLDEASLLAEARAKTGLRDFGDESFLEPMRRLLWSLEHEARLTPAGRAGHRTRIVGLLLARLQTNDWLVRHPEIEREPVDVRFVVVGFPRTGTTLLQRILARDPRAGSLAWWECRHPAPLPGWDPATARDVPDPRIERAKAEVAGMLAFNPALAAQHPLDAMAPDEDMMLLEHAFQASAPCGSNNVPSYMRWHLLEDGIASYRDHARLLRFLAWQKRMRGEPVGPYVLKAPHHMLHVDRLLEHFPNATIVQTHRDLLDTLPSLASLSLELRRLTSDTAHPSECAEYALATARARLAGLERVRAATPVKKWIDIWFGDVVAKPLAVVERIYDRIGLELPGPVREEMGRFIAENGRDRRPPHGYTLEQFGLDAASVEREFADYRARYVLPTIAARRATD
ncbi:MAG: sulfotransferase [Deltaproteobacteria bacterium]|nr:sulfotransferase [Deltaproteobacteria bacterium]